VTGDKPALSWTRVDQWAQQICAGDYADVERVFATETDRRPTVVWSPRADSIAAPPLRFLLEYWTDLAAGGVLPNRRCIDPLAMRPALGYIMLIDVVDHGRDFRYRLYGSTIALISKLDMTGRLMSTHPASSYVNEFGLAANRAVLNRRLPLYTERTPALAERTVRWQRIALPLADDLGDVTRILAGTVPIASDGRMIF
jgi:hypothetical protein